MPGGIVRRWRHLPLRRPAPGGLAATGGCGAVPGAAAARRASYALGPWPKPWNSAGS